MITYLSDAHDFRVTIQGDQDVPPSTQMHLYTRSKSMLRIERLDTQTTTLFAVRVQANPGQFVNYYSDPNGVLEIPMRNFVERNAAAGSLNLSIDMYDLTDLDNRVDYSAYVSFNVHNGISYYDLFPPQYDRAELQNLQRVYVTPPNVMLRPKTNPAYDGIMVESNLGNYGGTEGLLLWKELAGGVESGLNWTGPRGNVLELQRKADAIHVTDGDTWNIWYNIEDIPQCQPFVACKWTSLTGATRLHYFPVVAVGNGIDNAVSLVSAGNGYDVRRNAIKSVRCRLTGLTSYSVWYYSDMMQANDLHAVAIVTQAGFSYDIDSAENLAYVEGGADESPEGNGFFTFEFTLKLRHYDTV